MVKNITLRKRNRICLIRGNESRFLRWRCAGLSGGVQHFSGETNWSARTTPLFVRSQNQYFPTCTWNHIGWKATSVAVLDVTTTQLRKTYSCYWSVNGYIKWSTEREKRPGAIF